MPVITFDELAQTEGPLLGIDPGTKTFGLAVSDRLRMIATGRETIRREKFSIDGQKILKMIDGNEISAVIVGLPINMDGSHGPRAQSVRDFCANLLKLRDIPIFLWDERLSTMAVTRTMLEGDLSRKRRAEKVDKLAAAYILQGVLDRLRA
ncbi:MAG: Holliday junction resolvase RuvX [Hellea sp.]|nr:Holliday junction resolvase RuvX [Hellea sp.]